MIRDLLSRRQQESWGATLCSSVRPWNPKLLQLCAHASGYNQRVVVLQVAGILGGDPVLIGQALDSDIIVEPARGPLIPGFTAVKAAAKAAGMSCSRSHVPSQSESVAGPVRTAFAILATNADGLSRQPPKLQVCHMH